MNWSSGLFHFNIHLVSVVNIQFAIEELVVLEQERFQIVLL
jgi:hypothetical protein